MAEYMDYNDFDDEMTRGRRIRSILAVALAVAWLAGLVLWVIIRAPANTRTRFGTRESALHSLSETVEPGQENEFYRLYRALEEGTVSLSALQTEFPTVYAYIHMPQKQYPANENPILFESDGYLTLMLPYVVSSQQVLAGDTVMEKGILGFDFLLLPYRSAPDDEGYFVAFDAPIRFTMRYDLDAYRGTLEPLNTKSYRLNFYQLTLRLVDAPLDHLTYKAQLAYPLTKSESEHTKIQNAISLSGAKDARRYLSDGGGVSDDFLTCTYDSQDLKNADGVVLQFNDLLYRKLAAFAVRLRTAGDAPQFRLVLN